MGEGVCLSACWDAIPPRNRENPPGTRQTPPSPRTRQTPRDQGDPLGPGRHPPGPGRPPRAPPQEADSSIRSTSGRYASYWNAFLFQSCLSIIHVTSAYDVIGQSQVLWDPSGYVQTCSLGEPPPPQPLCSPYQWQIQDLPEGKLLFDQFFC